MILRVAHKATSVEEPVTIKLTAPIIVCEISIATETNKCFPALSELWHWIVFIVWINTCSHQKRIIYGSKSSKIKWDFEKRTGIIMHVIYKNKCINIPLARRLTTHVLCKPTRKYKHTTVLLKNILFPMKILRDPQL